MTDESEEIGIDELDWENAAVHVPLGVQIIKATETLGQDRDRWKAQAEQLQERVTELEADRELRMSGAFRLQDQRDLLQAALQDIANAPGTSARMALNAVRRIAREALEKIK